MKNNIKDQILLKIKEYDKIICLHHILPDGDAYGSAFGIANFIKDNFPNKNVLVDGEKNEYLNFLIKHDNVKKEDYKDALIIITDTPNIERISSLYWQKGKEVINIDHHPSKTTPFGNLQWIDDTRISASELIAELIYYSNLKISAKTARLIYTGILTDSNRFLYYKTDDKTLNLASKLLSTGFNVQKIYENLYQENLVNVKFKGYLLSKLKLTKHGVVYITISDKLLVKHQITYETVKSWINIMDNIKNIKIWVLFLENKKENYINISIRSNKYIINNVAALYNGGGHQLASGAKIFHWNKIKNVLNDLDDVILNKEQIKEIKK